MAWQSSDWLSSNRHDAFRYVEVDRATMRDVRDIGSIEETGGSIKYQDLTSLKVSADLPFVGDFGIGANYLRIYSVSTLGDESITMLHGTFMPSRPSTDYSGAAATGTIDCYSLLKVLDDMAVEEPLTIAPGSDPVGQATLLVADAGLAFIADESAMLLSSSRSYDAGTSYLEICNDLMGVAGFGSLGIDASGAVRLERYMDPTDLSPLWTLRDDRPGVVFGPDVSHDFDVFDVPNKVIAIKSNASDEEPLMATAVNNDPLSVFSTVARGREVVHVATVSDVEDQEALQTVAERILIEKSGAVESIEVRHSFLPYNAGKALRLVYTRHSIDVTGVVVSKELGLERGMPCKARIRRFVRRSKDGD